MAKRQSLGRGLGALIPDVSRETTATKTPAKKGSTKPASKPATSKKPATGAKASTTKAPVKATSSQASGSPAKAPVAIAGLTFAELPVRSIVPNAQQPRQVFDDEALAELVHSIKEVGLLQPIVVRPTAGGGYELVAGRAQITSN